ncbi:MAG: pyridoxamine 5'-phosphate oxidase family protein [Deltaproteobacteria bacterium]|nr:pyridoxamine 5'-phosphate oxidase family protein [Deltaproteobacteria bacterium]MBW2157903.1 pyridoxamine 5'-phosphate oxidase family protein [Deltaproteobacteria bacterium]MBW2326302.1 pyridoxamine 5'-phosphate oxidase family protein [Deltaproteobacteria bacterium]
MTHHEDIKKHIRELFNDQKLAVLSTHRSGQPYASLVAFVGKEDLKEIFFVTPRTTRKYKKPYLAQQVYSNPHSIALKLRNHV